MKEKKYPIILNTYKLNSVEFINKIGVKVFHTAIEFNDVEYAFGYHEFTSSGIYKSTPLTFENGEFCESIVMGYCHKDSFNKIYDELAITYIGNTYNILAKNCNHFSNEVCKKLFNKEIPKQFSLGLKLGEFVRRFI